MQGGESHQTDLAAAEQCSRLFTRYEDKDPAVLLEQGTETADFKKAFKMPMQRPPLVPHVNTTQLPGKKHLLLDPWKICCIADCIQDDALVQE